MINFKSACYYCKEHRTGCHSNCEKYLAYRLELEEKRKIIQEEKAKEVQFYAYRLAAMERMKKKH